MRRSTSAASVRVVATLPRWRSFPRLPGVKARQNSQGRAIEVGLAGKLVNAARVVEEFRHFGPRPEGGVLVDHGAIGPEIAAGGIEAHEVEVVLHALARGSEKIAQNVRHGQQRRPHVPAKAIDREFLQLAARLGVLLPHLDRMTGAREADGGRQSAQAGADDEDLLHSPFISRKRAQRIEGGWRNRSRARKGVESPAAGPRSHECGYGGLALSAGGVLDSPGGIAHVSFPA